MSETRFTPGPWEAEMHAHGHWLIRHAHSPTAYIAEQFDYVNPANAHLIAAAPDLYAALEGMARWMDWVYDDRPVAEKEPVDPAIAYEMATAALAKARGEVTT